MYFELEFVEALDCSDWEFSRDEKINEVMREYVTEALRNSYNDDNPWASWAYSTSENRKKRTPTTICILWGMGFEEASSDLDISDLVDEEIEEYEGGEENTKRLTALSSGLRSLADKIDAAIKEKAK